MSATTAAGPGGFAPVDPNQTGHGSHGILRLLMVESPYILMLAMALLGIAYRAFVGHPIVAYWEFLMPVFGVLCILTGLRHVRSRQEGIDLVWTQVLHWSAFLAGMYVLTLTPVEGALDDNAAALLQLVMLALGVFLAGVHTHSWRLCVVGTVLGIAIPTVAWVNHSALLIGILATIVALAFGTLWVQQRRASSMTVE